MPEFLFDVKLFAGVRVTASTEAEARAMIVAAIDGGSANLGAWPDGSPIVANVALDEPENDELQEIDGEAV